MTYPPSNNPNTWSYGTCQSCGYNTGWVKTQDIKNQLAIHKCIDRYFPRVGKEGTM